MESPIQGCVRKIRLRRLSGELYAVTRDTQPGRTPTLRRLLAADRPRAREGVSHVDQLEQKVIEIVSEKLSVPKEEITLESNFVDDLKADSLDLVEMVMAFEDALGVSIPDEDQEKIRTVGEVITYIRKKGNA